MIIIIIIMIIMSERSVPCFRSSLSAVYYISMEQFCFRCNLDSCSQQRKHEIYLFHNNQYISFPKHVLTIDNVGRISIKHFRKKEKSFIDYNFLFK